MIPRLSLLVITCCQLITLANGEYAKDKVTLSRRQLLNLPSLLTAITKTTTGKTVGGGLALAPLQACLQDTFEIILESTKLAGAVQGSIENGRLTATARALYAAKFDRNSVINFLCGLKTVYGLEIACESLVTCNGGKPTLKYKGGPVLKNVVVTPIFYGPVNESFASSLQAYYSNIVISPHFDMLSQYNVFKGTVEPAVHWATGLAINGPSEQNITAMFTSLINAGTIAVTANSYFPIHLTGEYSHDCSKECASHGNMTINNVAVYYAIIPEMKSDGPCGKCIYPGETEWQGVEIAASHELVEAVTNPNGRTGWMINDLEISDLCHSTYDRLYVSNETVIGVQNAWSNSDKGCVPRNSYGVSYDPLPNTTLYFTKSPILVQNSVDTYIAQICLNWAKTNKFIPFDESSFSKNPDAYKPWNAASCNQLVWGLQNNVWPGYNDHLLSDAQKSVYDNVTMCVLSGYLYNVRPFVSFGRLPQNLKAAWQAKGCHWIVSSRRVSAMTISGRWKLDTVALSSHEDYPAFQACLSMRSQYRIVPYFKYSVAKTPVSAKWYGLACDALIYGVDNNLVPFHTIRWTQVAPVTTKDTCILAAFLYNIKPPNWNGYKIPAFRGGWDKADCNTIVMDWRADVSDLLQSSS